MGHHAEVFEDVLSPQIAEKPDDFFVDATIECVDLHDPWEVDYINSPQKIDQCGIFEDAEGREIRFKAWSASDPPTFEEGGTYDIEDMQLVYGKNADAYAFVIRSKTTASQSEGFPSGVGDATCTCGTELTDADLQRGPGAPEIGWEYYECSNCGDRHRPGAV